jgi:hypothetical protein
VVGPTHPDASTFARGQKDGSRKRFNVVVETPLRCWFTKSSAVHMLNGMYGAADGADAASVATCPVVTRASLYAR